MKYQIVAFLTLISLVSIAKSINQTTDIKMAGGTIYTVKIKNIVKKNEDNKFKGTLVFDPKSCRFNLIRNDVIISLVDGVDSNFQIQFPDGRTVIGQIADADESKKNPACFHSLGEKPKAKDVPNWLILGNNTDLGGRDLSESNGLVNCKSRNGGKVESSVSYISKEEFDTNCGKDSSKCRVSEQQIRIRSGTGLLFLQGEKQIGSNVKREDLKFDDSFQSRCEPSTNPKPPAPAEAKAPQKTT